MLWWFEREGRRTTISANLPTGECELRFVDADGVSVEHFPNAADLAKRQQAMQDALVALFGETAGETG